jgi:large subunit ribosomal protein L4
MQVNVTACKTGKVNGTIDIVDAIFGEAYNEPLVHQIVTSYQAGGRAGTVSQKTRAEVRGGGRKPWKQKGTGNARAGSIRSPLWRTGGVIFAAKPRDYAKKVNKKMYAKAMKSVWAELNRSGRLLVIDALTFETPKTKQFVELLARLELTRALFITDETDENVYLASRNLSTVDVCNIREVNPVALIAYDKVVITVAGLQKLQEVMGA